MLTTNKVAVAKDGQQFLTIKDAKTNQIESLATLFDFRVGSVDKVASIFTSGDVKVHGAGYFEGGAKGVFKLPNGTRSVRSGENIVVDYNPDGSIVINAIQSSTSSNFLTLSSDLQTLCSRVDNLFVTSSFLQTEIQTLTGTICFLSSCLDTRITEISSSLISFESFVSSSLSNVNFNVTNLRAGSGAGLSLISEIPSGIKDASNKTFTLTYEPVPISSLKFYINQQLVPCNGVNYNVSGKTVTLPDAIASPLPSDTITAAYSYESPIKSYSVNELLTPRISGGICEIELANEPSPPESLMLFMNGQLLTAGDTGDYSLLGKVATINDSLFDVETSDFFATYSYDINVKHEATDFVCSLDSAYDNGGSGDGKMINADSGPVTIDAASSLALLVSGTVQLAGTMNDAPALRVMNSNVELSNTSKMKIGLENNLQIYHTDEIGVIENNFGNLIINSAPGFSTNVVISGSDNAQFRIARKLASTFEPLLSVKSNGDIFFGSANEGSSTFLNNLLGKRIQAKHVASTKQILDDAPTIIWNADMGSVMQVTLKGDRVLAAPSNIVSGGTYIAIIKQDNVGGHKITWNAVYKFQDAFSKELTPFANAVDVAQFVSDGENLYGTLIKNVN